MCVIGQETPASNTVGKPTLLAQEVAGFPSITLVGFAGSLESGQGSHGTVDSNEPSTSMILSL